MRSLTQFRGAAVRSKLSILERHAGEVVILSLTGQIVLDDGDLAFGRYVSDLISRGLVRIIVDLAFVTYIDSSGVCMMAAEVKHARQSGGDMRLLHLTHCSQRLLGTMKLLMTFEIFEDEAAAVRSFTFRPTA